MNKKETQEYNKAYYKTNIAKIKTQHREYRRLHYQEYLEKKRIWGKIYRQANPEKVKARGRAYSKAYRLLHSVKDKARKKLYFQTHPEKVKEYRIRYKVKGKLYCEKYRQEHPERRKVSCKIWKQSNPEQARKDARKRKALKLGVGHESYTESQIFQRDGHICQLCGNKINMKLKHPDSLSPSIDHIIPISKGGADAPVNVQAAHLGCNIVKHAGAGGQLRLFG